MPGPSPEFLLGDLLQIAMEIPGVSRLSLREDWEEAEGFPPTSGRPRCKCDGGHGWMQLEIGDHGSELGIVDGCSFN